MKPLLFLALCTSSWAANYYYANAASGSNNGTSCANAWAWTDGTNGINTSGKWVAGNVLHLCGTITGTNGGNGITAAASGASGNPITVKFETGAILQAGWWGTSESSHTGAIRFIGVNYVTLDLGTNGIIRNTLAGSAGTSCIGGACANHDSALVVLSNCSNCTITAASPYAGDLGPSYQRNSFTDGGNGVVMWIDGVVNNLVIQNTKMHGASGLIWWGLDQGSCSGNVCSNLFTFTGNEVTDTSTGIAFAQGSGSNRISDIEIYGNHVHDFQNWNDASSYDHHHEFIHMYTYGTAALPMNLYNNVFDGDAGSGTAWIYIEINSGASGGGPINIFNNLFAACASAIPSLGAGGMRMLEIEYGNVPTKIYNNTFWGTPNANCTISQAGQTTVNIMNGIYLNATNTQPDVRNNIVGGVLGNGFESGTLGASSSNNLLVCGGMSTPVNGTGGPVPSCGTNPNLNASYKIQNTSSSAYHTGANLTGNPNANINVDLASVGRPASGAWDIGAYQYAASAVAPAVATTAASGITSTTASSGGNVTSDGGASVTARGVCYATTANPTSPCTSDGTGTGVFTSSLSGLTSNTLYHIRAFATNSAGTSYGSDLTFTTLPPPAPIVSLDATSHDFGAQMVGIQSSGFVFNLQNTGNAVLAITSITPSGDFSSSSNCPISPSTLGIGSSCTITATFRPTLVGARSGSILISDNAADTPQAISLSGTGLPTQAGSVGTGISAGWVVVR